MHLKEGSIATRGKKGLSQANLRYREFIGPKYFFLKGHYALVRLLSLSKPFANNYKNKTKRK